MAFDSQRRSWAAKRMLSRPTKLGSLTAWAGLRKTGSANLQNWAPHGKQTFRVSRRANALRKG
jgi:hypothetical protein